MQTIIYSTLKEEKQRNLELQDIYKAKLTQYPRGSLMTKTVNGKNYYYLHYRDGKKTKSDYIGNDEKAAEDIKKSIAERNRAQFVLRRLKKEYKEICRIVKE